ncbi:MAG TPA: aminotransferase class I/II-fold pyridoxal phosphate-dependent enzyme, partial [Bryobacteraceae bacterium]|nr:aminotransferase class I/II-fold pyridoxal phosphate-dependent enzyme [Bryobacteraceae bacterium]
SVTGWRVGWVIASPEITGTVRKVHDFLTVGAATPLQQAGIMALGLPDSYFDSLSAEYDGRRQAAVTMLREAGFHCYVPGGAYYVMCDMRALSRMTDVEFATDLVERVGVAGVPGSSFYLDPARGSSQIRFCFCKKYETLAAAGERLKKI